MKLVWTNRARQDLESIRRFSVARWGRQTAYRYLAALRDAAKAVAADRTRSRPLAGRFRAVRSQSHILIVVVDETAGQAVIARVLHAAMDLERHLPPVD